MHNYFLGDIFDAMSFLTFVNFFSIFSVCILSAALVLPDFFLYSSNITRMIPAIGMASIIPSIQPSVPPINIIMNTKNGERSNDRLIMYGTRKLFSTCCMMI